MAPPRSTRAYRSRPSRRRVALRRALAAGFLALFFGVALWLGTGAFGEAGEEEVAPPATTRPPKPPPTLKIVFPEGFTRNEMIQRVGVVRNIAQRKRKITPRLSGAKYAAASKAAKPPAQFRGDAKGIEGFLFPATYEFTAKTTSKRLVADQLIVLQPELEEGRSAGGEGEEPDAVRRPDHRLDDREGDDRSRGARQGRRRDLQPAEGGDAARDRRDDPLRARHSRNRGAPGLAARERQPVQHAQPDRAAADADRESGARLDAAAAKPADADFLFFVRKPDKIHHFFTASESEFFAKACEYGFGCG